MCLSGPSLVQSHLHLRPPIGHRRSSAQGYSFIDLDLNITSVVTAEREVKLVYPCANIQDYLCVPAQDKENYDISQHFDEVFNFIERVREKGNVLVHCILGISRSATLVLAYLIRKNGISLDEAMALVRRKRPIVLLSTCRLTPILGSCVCCRITAKDTVGLEWIALLGG
jgi:hypothetical protein